MTRGRLWPTAVMSDFGLGIAVDWPHRADHKLCIRFGTGSRQATISTSSAVATRLTMMPTATGSEAGTSLESSMTASATFFTN